jgi:hypothetical protein
MPSIGNSVFFAEFAQVHMCLSSLPTRRLFKNVRISRVSYWGAPKSFASSLPLELGPRSASILGLHKGTDAQARAEAWQTAEAAA